MLWLIVGAILALGFVAMLYVVLAGVVGVIAGLDEEDWP